MGSPPGPETRCPLPDNPSVQLPSLIPGLQRVCPEALEAKVDRKDPSSQLESRSAEKAGEPPVVRPLAFAQSSLPCRPLLTSCLLSQSLSWDRIHGCHQGAGPTLAGNDPAGAETILVRGPCLGGAGGGVEGPSWLLTPALIFRALGFVILGTGWSLLLGWKIWLLPTLRRSLGAVTEVGKCLTSELRRANSQIWALDPFCPSCPREFLRAGSSVLFPCH